MEGRVISSFETLVSLNKFCWCCAGRTTTAKRTARGRPRPRHAPATGFRSRYSTPCGAKFDQMEWSQDLCPFGPHHDFLFLQIIDEIPTRFLRVCSRHKKSSLAALLWGDGLQCSAFQPSRIHESIRTPSIPSRQKPVLISVRVCCAPQNCGGEAGYIRGDLTPKCSGKKRICPEICRNLEQFRGNLRCSFGVNCSKMETNLLTWGWILGSGASGGRVDLGEPWLESYVRVGRIHPLVSTSQPRIVLRNFLRGISWTRQLPCPCQFPGH